MTTPLLRILRILRTAVFLVLVLATALAVGLLPAHPVTAQSGHTCLSTVSGEWSNPMTWNQCGGGTPGAADDAYVQSGYIVTLTQDEAVHDLHISTGTDGPTVGSDGKLALGAHTLDVYGKLRNYFGTLFQPPGMSSTSIGSAPIVMTAGSAGRVRFVGDTRSITNFGEWSVATTGSATTFAVEIALSANQTATLQIPLKASAWTITSGILDASGSRIVVDNGFTGSGTVTVAAGATLISAATTINNPVVSRTIAARGGDFIVDGTLVLMGQAPYIGMNTVVFNGPVDYASPQAQVLAQATAITAASPTRYTDLRLSGNGIKGLGANITVAHKFTLAGTATLGVGASALAYAPGAVLEYAGTLAQTTGAEFLSSGIEALTIANPAGVTLAADRTVTGTVTLATGDLNTGAHTLTLAPTATCAGAGDVAGTVSRPDPAVGQAYCFGHPDVQLTLAAGSTPPTALAVTLAKGVAPFDGAVSRTYTVTAPGFAGMAALRLHYAESERAGNDAAALQLWRQEGSRWIAQPRTGAGADYVEKSDVTAFSTWALAANGAPTAVTLIAFTADARADPVLLRWSTGSELTNWGFSLYRALEPGSVPVRLNPALIPSQDPGSPTGYDYTWEDRDALQPGATYTYWLEDVDFQQTVTRHAPVSATIAAQASLYLPFAAADAP